MFHGFYYTNDREHAGQIVALPLTDRQDAVWQAVLEQFPLETIDYETYWRSCYRFLMYDAPQGYVAWDKRSFWLVALPQVDDGGHFDRTANGMHVLEFTHNVIRHAWVPGLQFREPPPAGHQSMQFEDSGMMRAIEAMRVFGRTDDNTAEDDADDVIEITLPDALSELVVTPWYWHQRGMGCDRQRSLDEDELACLKDNVGWTDDLHRDMAERLGPDACAGM
ncbi:MAG: hypothetical protein PF961_05780 [Planctomycetota bacterium]|jgi:hypothetical protein|nr:hypothetical protein [Planctomycetota bacterium]